MTKKICLYFLLSYFLKFPDSNGQTYTLYGDKTFGGNLTERYVNLEYGNNNELIIFGTSATNLNGDKTDPLCDSINPDVWILKITPSFNIVWNKSLGAEDNEDSPHLQLISNNKMIFSCRSRSDSACEKSEHNRDTMPPFTNDFWICMLDSSGNKIWDKTLGGIETESYSRIIQLSTGNFMVVGTSSSPVGADKTVANYGLIDFWAVALDSLGNKLWDNVFGGSGSEVGLSGNNNGFSVLACDNGSFIIAGRTDSPVSGNVSDPGQGGFDVWLIKIDSSGNKIWDKRYGGSSNSDGCSQIIQTNDGYILLGGTSSPQGGSISDPPIGLGDIWVIKLDSAGNKQWDKRYGGSGSNAASSIAAAPGGGYWVFGSTNSPIGFDVTEPSYGGYDYWILKIDSVGNKLWDKRFGASTDEQPANFVIMPDSSIFLCGFADTGTSSTKTDFGKGALDYWLVHFKYTDTTTGTKQFVISTNQITIAPNPTKGIINLNSTSTGAATLSVSNVLGAKVYESKIVLQQKNTLNFTTLPKGMYFLKVEQAQGGTSVAKFIKQ